MPHFLRDRFASFFHTQQVLLYWFYLFIFNILPGMVCWIIQKKSTVKGSLWVHHVLSAENWHITSKETMDHKNVSLDREKAWKGKRKFLRFRISKTSYFISFLYVHMSTILKINLLSGLHMLNVIQQILQRVTSFGCDFFPVVQYSTIYKSS